MKRVRLSPVFKFCFPDRRRADATAPVVLRHGASQVMIYRVVVRMLLLLLIADGVLCIASQLVSQGRLLSPPLEFQRARLKNDRTENDEAIESTHNEWRHEVPAEGQASRLLALWYGGHLRPCRDRIRRSIVLH